jgi:hypothetical protein
MSDTTTHGSDCVCGGCGLVPVDEDYVSRQAAKMRLPDGSLRPGTLEGLRNSFTPCFDCAAEVYEEWRQGRSMASRGGTRPARTGGRRKYRRRGD